jgi:superoxide reductase
MTKLREIYKCEVCGNIVEVIHESGGTLVCCGKPMMLQKENSVDAERFHENKSDSKNKNPSGVASPEEKHVPIIEKTSNGIKVRVGSVPHPMIPEHYIEWIELIADETSYKKFLKPEDKPEAEFCIEAKNITATAYCNLHGLWKSL